MPCKTPKCLPIIIVIAIVVGIGYYFVKTRQTASLYDESRGFSTLTIMVPEDIREYEVAMTKYVQTGEGENPAKTLPFVQKKVAIRSVADVMRASANAAAAEIKIGSGHEYAKVEYIEVKNRTAYVVLNIDKDGWTGVSVSIAKIHPLVEKTLLEYKQIERVVFDYAPGGE